MAQNDANTVFSLFAICILGGTLINIATLGASGIISAIVVLYFASSFLGGFYSPPKRAKGSRQDR
jgi:hypothetical protein